MSEIDRERARQGCALAAPATKDGRLSGLAAAGQRCVVGVVCVCVGSEVWASPSVRGLRHASMGEVEGGEDCRSAQGRAAEAGLVQMQG